MIVGAILLIDDSPELLRELEEELKAQFKPGEATIVTWVPRAAKDPKLEFERYVKDNDLRLVVTDYDLTKGGQAGFFGSTVVDWCQSQAIPVGDFSRRQNDALPKEPNLFEIRVPVISNEVAAKYIAGVFRGFEEIRVAIASDTTLIKRRSPASALAALLGAKNDENQFAQYVSRFTGTSSALINRLVRTASKNQKPSEGDKTSILSYIVGHILLNAVLRFPGPIVNMDALAAYLAVAITEQDTINKLFAFARYSGPFSALGPYFWTRKVDDKLGEFEQLIPADLEFESVGEKNRKSIEVHLNREFLRPIGCDRCNGKNGGFLCPFTNRTVCQRQDCSVVSNVLVPQGARLSRIEREFYDEWAPILGM
jgi:hypothetical protein